MAKKVRNPEAAFGLLDYTMIPKLRRLLKPYGLTLKTCSDRKNWGDQVEVTVERIEQPLDIAAAQANLIQKNKGMGTAVQFGDNRGEVATAVAEFLAAMEEIREDPDEEAAFLLFGTTVMMFELQGLMLRPLLPGESNFDTKQPDA
jgi:hypothetical protein